MPGSVTFMSGSGTLNGSTIELTAAGSTAGGCTLVVAATLTRIAVPPQGSR